MRERALFFLATLIVLVTIHAPIVHADTCSIAGTRPATAEDAAVKNGEITVGTCYNPNDKAIGQSAEEAKQYLFSISSKSSTSDKSHIDKLNNAFAVCSALFFKSYTSKYGTVKITSAWRSEADQARVSTSPTSNHTKGLAIDVQPSNGNYDTLMNFAKENKQFGVCFARPTYNGGPDLPHMTAAGIGSKTEDCGKYGITKMCDAGNFDPSSVKYSPPSSYSSGAPYSQTSPLGYGQQTNNQNGCPTGYVVYNGQCYSMQSQPMNQSQQPMQYAQQSQPQQQSPQSSSQTGQTTGTTGTTNGGVQFNTNTNSSSGSSSLNALIRALGATSSGSATSVGTSTDFSLSSSPINGVIGNSITAGNTATIGQQTSATDSISYGQPPPTQETFQSTDLSQTPITTNQNPGLVSTTLENLKRALLYVLDFLTNLKAGASKQQLLDIPKPVMIQPIQTSPMYGGGE